MVNYAIEVGAVGPCFALNDSTVFYNETGMLIIDTINVRNQTEPHFLGQYKKGDQIGTLTGISKIGASGKVLVQVKMQVAIGVYGFFGIPVFENFERDLYLLPTEITKLSASEIATIEKAKKQQQLSNLLNDDGTPKGATGSGDDKPKSSSMPTKSWVYVGLVAALASILFWAFKKKKTV